MSFDTSSKKADVRIDPHRLVFVGGLHRSGTTPLTRMLAEHGSVSGLSSTGVEEDEGQHLQKVYPIARSYGGAGLFAFDPRAHLTENSPVRTASSATDLLGAWSPYWDTSRDLLVEKSPPNLLMGRFLQSVFPGSCLVVVIRNPVIVALSTKKWARWTSLPRLVQHWFVAHETLREDAQQLERLLVLRYEDLVSDPEQTLEQLRRFLGLSGEIPHRRLDPARSLPYLGRWDKMATGTPLQRRARRVIEERFSDDMTRYGYDIHDLTAHRTWAWS